MSTRPVYNDAAGPGADNTWPGLNTTTLKRRIVMLAGNSKRVVVWVQHFADRPYLMLQWHDPETGKRKSQSAQTNNPVEAEFKRADLESDLNNNRYVESSRMSWERFRELFELEYVAGTRPDTQRNYRATFDLFERLCNPTSLRSISERTVSQFVAALRREPGRAKGSTSQMASTIHVRLEFLHTALAWAADQGLLAKCPKFPAIRVPKKRPQPVPAESFERLLAKAADDQLRAYILCGWLGGMRMGEAFLLEREPTNEAPYLDLGRNRIIFPADFVKAVEDQWVPLDPALRAALLALPAHGRRVFHFTSSRSGLPVGAHSVADRVRRLPTRRGSS
jgi:integrase